MALSLGTLWISERRPTHDLGVALLVAALTFAVVAFLGSSASIAQGAGAVAAASGGLLLWSWPRDRWPRPGAAALLGALGALALLGQQALLYTRASATSLAAMALILWIPALPLSFPAKDRPLRAFAVLAASLPLALVAVVLAWYQAQNSA